MYENVEQEPEQLTENERGVEAAADNPQLDCAQWFERHGVSR